MLNKPKHQDHLQVRSKFARRVYVSLGFIFVFLGFIGIFLPIMPTAPFMIIAAACFARGSEKFYLALLNHRIFGPPIQRWRDHGVINKRGKWTSILTIIFGFGTSIVLFVPTKKLKLICVAIALVVILFIASRPSEIPE